MLRALLVGIDKYAGEPAALQACVADTLAWREYLHRKEDLSADVMLLHDQAATRSALITAFRCHLVAASQPGDTCLFAFSGHGSSEPAPAAFAPFFSDQRLETLVCYDSRTTGGLDLADKELALLLAEIPAGVHVGVVLDCCHSGSGTRGRSPAVRYRQTPAAEQPRTLDAFLEGQFAQQLRQTGDLQLPARAHVLLAACDRRQLAAEEAGRGVFTRCLLQQLDNLAGRETCNHLFLQLQQQMFSEGWRQQPQMELYTGIPPNANFLTGREERQRVRVPVRFTDQQWEAAFGAAQGQLGGKPTTYPVYAEAVGPERVGSATVVRLGFLASIVSLDFPADSNHIYYVNYPTLSLPVFVSAPAIRHAFAGRATERGITSVQFTADPGEASYSIHKKQDTLELYDSGSGFLIQGVRGDTTGLIDHLLDQLLKIGRWHTLSRCRSSETPPAPATEFGFQIGWRQGLQTEWCLTSDPALDFHRQHDGSFAPLAFRLRGWNTSRYPLYFFVLFLSPDYGIYKLYEDNCAVRPHTPAVRLLENEPDAWLYLPEESPATVVDEFLLIASRQPILTHYLAQNGITPWGETCTVSGNRSATWERETAAAWPDCWSVRRIRVRLQAVAPTATKP